MSFLAIACSVVMGLCGLIILLNWGSIINAAIKRQSFSFTPPFLCGIFGFIATLVYPDSQISKFAWVFLLADPSIMFMIWAMLGMALLAIYNMVKPK